MDEQSSIQQVVDKKKPRWFSLRARVAFGVALPIFIVLVFLSIFNNSQEY